MTVLSDYLEDALADHAFGKASYTQPSIWIALSTTAPADDGSNVTEPSGNNYSRKSTAAGDWNTASSGTTDNAAEIDFADPSGSWGTVTHFAAYDASTSGNMLFYGTLDEAKAITASNDVSIAAGDISLTLGGGMSDYLRDALLDHLFGKASFTMPSTYVAVSSTAPASDDTNVTEPGNGYAREQVLAAGWNAASGGVITNNGVIQFNEATGTWSTPSHFLVYDALTSGNLLWFGSIDSPEAIGDQDTLEFGDTLIDFTVV